MNLLISLFCCQHAYVAYGKMSLIKLAPFFFLQGIHHKLRLSLQQGGTGSQTGCYKTEKSQDDTPLSFIMELLCLLSTLEEVVLLWALAKRWHTIYVSMVPWYRNDQSNDPLSSNEIQQLLTVSHFKCITSHCRSILILPNKPVLTIYFSKMSKNLLYI